MKRAILVISTFILLVACCVVEEIYLKNNLKLLNEKTINLKEIVMKNDNVSSDQVQNEILSLETFWNKTESYFCIVVNHINIEEVGEQVSKIKTFSNENKKDELLVEIDLLIYYSKSYEHLIVPSIQNIL